MQQIHVPKVDARYWTAITLASVFGTNLGDLYAHKSGLGIWKGLAVLAVLTAVAFVVERLDTVRHEVYYWLVIILIRTGATNLADYLMYRARVPEPYLPLGLLIVLALFAWGTHRARVQTDSLYTLPRTNAAYWMAMLSAGVFGTVAGDLCEEAIGQGRAAVVLFIVLLAVLLPLRQSAARMIAAYWLTVAVARTAGTAAGDWLAENKVIPIGLPYATLLSGIAFVAVLLAGAFLSQRRTADTIA